MSMGGTWMERQALDRRQGRWLGTGFRDATQDDGHGFRSAQLSGPI